MSQSRLELKVGAFVTVCLVLLGILLVEFSKSSTWFRKSYEIKASASNVSGLRKRAPVLMAGVGIGRIERADLLPPGTNVTLYLTIYEPYKIRSDATASIVPEGLLGDQFISIDPGASRGYELTNGSTIVVSPPVNLLDLSHSAIESLNHIDATVSNLNAAISDVRSDLLNEKTLTNIANTITVLEHASSDVLAVADTVNQIIRTNGAPAAAAVSNLVAFSARLNKIAGDAEGILNTNSPQINAIIGNLRDASDNVNHVSADVRAGHGLAGSLVANEQLSANISATANNLAMTSSNLNRFGLWHFLFHKNEPSPASGPK
jgi:phospholipid/cholesterol/gamma-HCH transport system substrate-binding protein